MHRRSFLFLLQYLIYSEDLKSGRSKSGFVQNPDLFLPGFQIDFNIQNPDFVVLTDVSEIQTYFYAIKIKDFSFLLIETFEVVLTDRRLWLLSPCSVFPGETYEDFWRKKVTLKILILLLTKGINNVLHHKIVRGFRD